MVTATIVTTSAAPITPTSTGSSRRRARSATTSETERMTRPTATAASR